MKQKIHCIIQCRMSSTRLPAKIFLPGPKKALIDHLIERISLSKKIEKIILAIPNSKENLFIKKYFKNKIDIFCADEFNVLKRYYLFAKKFQTSIIVRITSDCPLMDHRIIDEILDYYKKNKCDYISNLHPTAFPDGFDIEIFTFQALKKAYKEAKQNFEKEHVTPYIWDNPEKFIIKNYWPPYIKKTFYNKYRLTLDYLEDFLLISKIYNKFYFNDKKFSFFKIMRYLKKNPNVLRLNKKFIKVNWYRHHLNELRSIKKKDTKII